MTAFQKIGYATAYGRFIPLRSELGISRLQIQD